MRWQIPVGAASLCLALGGVGLLFNSGGGSLPAGIQSEAVAAALTEARSTASISARDAYVMELPVFEPSATVLLDETPTPEPTAETRVLAASSSGVRSLPPPPPPTATPTPSPTIAPTLTPTATATPTRTATVEPTAPAAETPAPGTLGGPDGIHTNEPKTPPLVGGGASQIPVETDSKGTLQ